MKRERTTMVVVHCSATPPTLNANAALIREWHLERGFSDIGYHWIVRRNGDIEAGRPGGDVGAHAAGFNSASLGICLVGGVDGMLRPDFNFTDAQMRSLHTLLEACTYAYPGIKVTGHRDLPGVNKACPSFAVAEWWDNGN